MTKLGVKISKDSQSIFITSKYHLSFLLVGSVSLREVKFNSRSTHFQIY